MNTLTILYTANGCVTQTRLRVCLVHNSMAFANQQGMYACVNVISIFHGKGPLITQVEKWRKHCNLIPSIRLDASPVLV